MMVDDAHSSGVLGRNGRGTVDHFGLHGRVDIQVGTLSKAVGVLGGYVCGSRDLIDYLYHRARPSCSPPRIHRQSPRLAWRRSTSWRTNPSGSSSCGLIRSTSRQVYELPVSALAHRRRPSRPSTWEMPQRHRVLTCLVRCRRLCNRHWIPYGAARESANPCHCNCSPHFLPARSSSRRDSFRCQAPSDYSVAQRI
jgi:hypothetical protein